MTSRWAKRVAKSSENFQEAKKAKPTSYYRPEKGRYAVRVTTEMDENGDADIIRFKFTHADGPNEGRRWDDSIWFHPDDSDKKAEINHVILSKNIQILRPDIDMESLEPQDIDEVLEAISEEAPLVEVSVSHRFYKKRDGSTATGIVTYLNDLLTDKVAVEEADEPELPTPEPADDTDDSVSWERGDSVFYNDDECEIVSVNARKKTATVKNDEGEKFTSIAWDELTPA